MHFPCVFADELTFRSGDNVLTGHYLANTNAQPAKGVLLFVHGDGALSYDAEGYYSIVWRQLRAHGYAIFSWDKPGVGGSSGNWLNQSMKNRESEVIAAVKLIQDKYGFTAKNTGLLGFSQAGWVIPSLAADIKNIGFAIGIGFARSWVAQGIYLTKVRHENLGKSEKAVQAEIARYNNEIAAFKLSPAYSEAIKKSGLSKERFGFILRNYQSDASADYQKISVPILLLWGDDDLNVDAKNEYLSWVQNPNKLVTVKLINGASHGLLKSEHFNRQQFGFSQRVKLMWLGGDALAPKFMPTVLSWLDLHAKE